MTYQLPRSMEYDARELESFVLRSLKRQQNVQDHLIPQIIERTGWDWSTAEKYVGSMQSSRSLEITLWQGKLYTALSLLFIIGGLGMVLISVNAFLDLSQLLSCLSVHLANPDVAPFFECVRFIPEGLQSVETYLISGLCLILGGGVGIFLTRKQLMHGKMVVNG